MAAGDPTLAWFPEMLEELKNNWRDSLDWAVCVKLCNYMTEFRSQLKIKKGIQPALCRCKHCGGSAEIRPAPISIRSLLFALQKNNHVITI